MKTWTMGVVAIAAIIAAASPAAAAQHDHGAGGGDAALCAEAQPAVTQTLNAAMARLEAARQSNGATAMRAAIDEFQVALLALKTLLAPCAAPEPAGAPQAAAATSPSAAAPLAITFRPQGDPSPGSNTFEVTVQDMANQPVTDADVSVAFFMAAVPAMKMPAMRNEVKLAHNAAGLYRGPGTIMMAGAWEVTVTVARAGARVSKQFGLVAK